MVIIRIRKGKLCIVVILLLMVLVRYITTTYTYNFKYKNVYGYNKYKVLVIDKYSQNEESITYLIALQNRDMGSFKDRFLLRIKDTQNIYKYGDVLDVYGNISMPAVLGNDGEFNYKNYLNSKKIIGNIYAKTYEHTDSITGNIFLKYIKEYKTYVSHKMLQYVDNNNAGLIMGMVYGDTEYISLNTKQDFEKIGISHLTAVSGSNVATVIMVITYALDRFKLNKYVKVLIQVFFILAFLILCNTELSIMRACIMAICSIIFKVVNKKQTPFYSMLISFYIIVLINPYSILNVGMQLSFMASLSLIIFSKLVENMAKKMCKIKKLESKVNNAKRNTKLLTFILKVYILILEYLSLTISAQILILPLQIHYFKEYPLCVFLANIVASFIDTPICVMGIISVLFIWVPYLSVVLVYITSIFTNLLILSSNIISNFAYIITFKEQNIAIYILYYILILVIWFWNTRCRLNVLNKMTKLKYKIIMAILCIILVITTAVTNIWIKEYVYFFNVGQGSMNMVVTKKATVLIDAGSINLNTAYNTFSNFMTNENKFKVDLIIITHFDLDHVNGIGQILENYLVGKILIPDVPMSSSEYLYILELSTKKNVQIQKVCSGYMEKIANIEIEILAPSVDYITWGESFLNDNSIVCKVSVNGKNILFMGDATKYTEELLYNEDKLKFKVQILVVGHHGSSTSTTEELIQTILPDIAVISAKKSVYGHPTTRVLELLKKYSVRIYVTEQLGGIKYVL